MRKVAIIFLAAVMISFLGISCATEIRLGETRIGILETRMQMEEFLTQNLEIGEISRALYSLGWKKEILFMDVVVGFRPAAVNYQKFPNKLHVILGSYPVRLRMAGKNGKDLSKLTLKPTAVNVYGDVILVFDFENEEAVDSFVQDLVRVGGAELLIRASPLLSLNAYPMWPIMNRGVKYSLSGEVYLKAH